MDRWLEDTPFQDLSATQLPQDSLDRTISGFWMEGVGWNWSSFAILLANTTLLRMAAVKISSADEDHDKLIWTQSATGVLSVKTTFHLQAGWSKHGEWFGWKVIWKLRVPERLGVFLWQVARDRVLTNEAR